MPKYKFTALSENGENQEGVIEASSVDDARLLLRDRGLYLLETRELVEKGSKKEIELSVKIPTSDLAIFCNQFSAVLKAGVSILQALEIMGQQTENKKLKKVLEDVYSQIQRGVSVSNAFKEHAKRFPELFISMLEAGEASGNLDTALGRMGLALTKEHKLNQKVKSAMIYPMVLAVVAVLVVIFLMVAVVPTFAGMYSGAGQELPALTQMMLNIGDFMSRHFIMLLFILVTLVVLIRVILRIEDVKISFDRIKLKLPVAGKLMLKIVTARFTQSMSTLLTSGITLPQAIDITSRSLGNHYIAGLVRSLNSQIRSGRGLALPLEELEVFPMMVVQMVHLGEASGTLDQLLAKTAEFYEDEADAATTKLTSLMEPLIILIMGGLILTIVLSILLPMFGMFSLI